MLDYRECGERDCSVWVELNRAFMKEKIQKGDVWNDADQISESEFREIFYAGLKAPHQVRFLIFEEDEEPIGFANLVQYFSVWAHGQALIINDLYFSTAYKTKSIISRAIELIEDYARGQGCKRIQLHSLPTGQSEMEFYKSIGYQPVDMKFCMKYMDE